MLTVLHDRAEYDIYSDILIHLSKMSFSIRESELNDQNVTQFPKGNTSVF